MQPEEPCKSVNQPCVNWWAEVMERTATHIAETAMVPGWHAYCLDRVVRMEAEAGGHWVGLRAMVREKLAKLKGGK